MTPVHFVEANHRFGPPEGLTDSQVLTIPAWTGQAVGGSIDGLTMVVVAWSPTAEEAAEIASGKPIYLSCVGGLPPHLLSTSFYLATHPA